MSIKTTTWSPDTCECKIEYQWDDTMPESNRVHTGSVIVNKCQRHDGNNPNNHYAQVLADNRLKNNSLKVLAENYSELTEEKFGEIVIDLNKVLWFLNLSRVLELTISESSFDSAKKAQALALIEAEVGESERVVIM